VYDLVVVPNAPLASAIHRRIDRPHLGSFAITPRRLAARRREEAENGIAFLELIEYNDLDWKRGAYAIGNILQWWEHQGDLEGILDYDTCVDGTTHRAVERINDLDTTSKQLTEYQIDGGHDVTVVGYEQLTQLKRSILPAEYDRYDTFTDDEFDAPPFHIFDSSTVIVDSVADALTAENAEDVAAVLESRKERSHSLIVLLDQFSYRTSICSSPPACS
jgi:hypothetical protein